jgi:hypothetical protein
LIVNRLTVDGRDYFLPDPITELRDDILRAMQSGGGYVSIPPINGGRGVEILFSPGMPVLWTQLSLGDGVDAADVLQPEMHPDDGGFDNL